MRYKVIKKFKDTDKHIYNINDEFPHAKAKKPTVARLKVLSTKENKYKEPFIEKAEEKKKTDKKK